MIDILKMHLHFPLDVAMEMLAAACESQMGAEGYEAAKEARLLAAAVKGVTGTFIVSGADVVARANNALRANNRHDVTKRVDALVGMIQRDRQRRIVGTAMMGPKVTDIVQHAGKDGARIVGLEDPRSGDVVEIARIRGGIHGK